MEEALRVESFPMDKQGLYYTVGDLCLSTTRGEPTPVRDLLDEIPNDRFASADEALELIRTGLETLDRREAA
jgi:hypothetical protein